mgnify:CR=1 FL=1
MFEGAVVPERGLAVIFLRKRVFDRTLTVLVNDGDAGMKNYF